MPDRPSPASCPPVGRPSWAPPRGRGGHLPPPTLPGADAAAPEAQGRSRPWQRWSLWIVGRWPSLTQDIRMQPPCEFRLRRRRSRGPAIHLSAACRSPPAPARASPAGLCVRTGVEEPSGGNWMVIAVPRYAGGLALAGWYPPPRPWNQALASLGGPRAPTAWGSPRPAGARRSEVSG